jgi:hypothetical protein
VQQDLEPEDTEVWHHFLDEPRQRLRLDEKCSREVAFKGVEDGSGQWVEIIILLDTKPSYTRHAIEDLMNELRINRDKVAAFEANSH